MFDTKNRPTAEKVKQKVSEMILFDNVLAFSLNVIGEAKAGVATPMQLSGCVIGSPEVLLNGLVNLMEENPTVGCIVMQAADLHRQRSSGPGLDRLFDALKDIARRAE